MTMTISREQALNEMGLSPQWKLRDDRSVLRGAQVSAKNPLTAALAEAPVEPPVELPAAVRNENSRLQIPRAFVAPAGDRAEQIARLGWDELRQSVADCRACALCAQREQAVPGVGDLHADWLFVGEGPGEEEDLAGEPFVGQSGKLLDAMLAAIDLKRGADVYITNAVKCHSPENHMPKQAELTACGPYLKRQIALLQPKVIVLLGRVAAHAVLGEEGTLSGLRGKPFAYRDGERSIPVVVTYHPAYLLRTLPDKAKAWEDLCRARALMREAKAASLESATNASI